MIIKREERKKKKGPSRVRTGDLRSIASSIQPIKTSRANHYTIEPAVGKFQYIRRFMNPNVWKPIKKYKDNLYLPKYQLLELSRHSHPLTRSCYFFSLRNLGGWAWCGFVSESRVYPGDGALALAR